MLVRFSISLLSVIAILWLAWISGKPAVAHAGMFDRIKDIYNAPEKLNEVRENYDQVADRLAAQQAELAAAKREALEAALRFEQETREAALRFEQEQLRWQQENAAYRQQNEQLAAANSELAGRLESLEREKYNKDVLIDRIILITTSILGLILLCFLSMRLIRVALWRRDKASL